jgi:ERF superfamily protein
MDDHTTVEAPTPAPAAPIISAEKKAFLAALAKAQGAFEDIEKNTHVQVVPRDASKRPYEFDYADLAEILKKTRKALSENGLSTRVLLTGHDGDAVWLNSIVAHCDGYEDVSSLQISAVADDVKLFGGRITFIRRYLLGPQLGIAGDGDIDDNGQEPGEGEPPLDAARGAKVNEKPKATPARKSASAPPPPPPAPPAAADEPPDDGAPPIGEPRKPAAPVAAPTPPAPPPPAAPPVQAPAVAAAPAATGPVGEGTGELATEGECAYLVRRATQRNVVLRGVLDGLGLKNLGDTKEALVNKLTKAQWAAAMKHV